MGQALSRCLTFLSPFSIFARSHGGYSSSICSDRDEQLFVETRDSSYFADDELDSSDEEDYVYYSGGSFRARSHLYDADMRAGMLFYRGRPRVEW